jgi:hypothetical protein
MFYLAKNGPFTDSGVRQLLERRCADADIPPVHPHQFPPPWPMICSPQALGNTTPCARPRLIELQVGQVNGAGSFRPKVRRSAHCVPGHRSTRSRHVERVGSRQQQFSGAQHFRVGAHHLHRRPP